MLNSPLGRRDFFGKTLTGLGAISLPNILRLRAEAGLNSTSTDTSLILLWQDGGPSHFETFDPKPDAPIEIRGELGHIPTRIPGVRFCDVLPRLAQMNDRFTIIRSLHQASSAHVSATHTFVTGYDRTGVIKGPPRSPDCSTIINFMRSGHKGPLPTYVGLPEQARGGPGYLGHHFGPFRVKGDPSKPDFRIENLELAEASTPSRFDERFTLLKDFDRLRRDLDQSGQIEAMDQFQRQAANMLTGEAASAFDLTREDPRLRERYGMHLAGQQALLARRLVESGVSVVSVIFHPPGDWHPSWDDHPCGTHVFGTMRGRGPLVDQAVSALIQDLGDRGLDKKVLLVMAGEFGRTPRIRKHKGVPGRDHWGPAGCALVYGGGFQMGQVIGATNKNGEHPIDRPIRPQDVLATIYKFLGIDTEHMLTDLAGRPFPILPHGTPIHELTG